MELELSGDQMTGARNSQRWVRALVAVALAASASACGKPNPPLLPPGKAAALAPLKSPYAALAPSGDESDATFGATDIMVLQQGEILRTRARRAVESYASIYWPRQATWPSTSFGKFQHPTISCPPTSAEGEVCTLSFVPRSPPETTPASSSFDLEISPQLLKAIAAGESIAYAEGGMVTVRLDIDQGGDEPFLRPPPDARPLLAPGAPTSRIVTGDLELDHLGKQSVVCRADTPPGGTWERRNCAIEYGPVRMTVGHDVHLPDASASDAAFADPGDDPDMVADLREADQLFVDVIRDPILERAFPPMRLGNNADAMFSATLPQSFMPDDTAQIRGQAAKNAPVLAWHDVADEQEFDTLCLDAAKKALPLLIYTADGADNVPKIIYDDVFKLFAPRAMLVIVRMHPPAGDNVWAMRFADAIGAGQWSAYTVTDKPKWTHQTCKVGKVYQAKTDVAVPADMMRAIQRGRPQTASKPDAKT